MTDWLYQGEIPGSKSVFNRALIVQSYFPDLQLQGSSNCDDVRFMRSCIGQLNSAKDLDCGEGGTTFRFLALRASRMEGSRRLTGTRRLFERPQRGLLNLLSQLGVEVEIQTQALLIQGAGWKKPAKPVQVDTTESSQYASALVLNAWNLDFDLEFNLVGSKVSESYFQLTLRMLQEMGMEISQRGNLFVVPKDQSPRLKQYKVEADMSSVFTVAALGALLGPVAIENFPESTDQPDKVFLKIFEAMGVSVCLNNDKLEVFPSASMRSVEWDLGQSPDLFPVLAVLCSWAQGTSRLYGAPHLAAKESNRINKVADLFGRLGVTHRVLPDGMIIEGQPQQPLKQSIIFNPDHDHRMVMAAALMKLKGHGIKIEDTHVINKSFPEFWDIVGIQP